MDDRRSRAGEEVRPRQRAKAKPGRSEEHTSELQSQFHLVCRLLLEKKKQRTYDQVPIVSLNTPIKSNGPGSGQMQSTAEQYSAVEPRFPLASNQAQAVA